MSGEYSFIVKILPELGKGLLVSFRVSAVALVLGLAIGLPLALLRLYGRGVSKYLAWVYIEVIRGTPLLVQLFIIYYGLPDVGISFDRMTAAYLALGLNSGAYQAEYFRGAIQAIPVGQMSAARSLGMSQLQALIHVILPQALRLVLPAWSNEAIYLIKYASVTYTIAVPELLAKGQILNSRYFRPVEIFLVVSLIYIGVISIIAWLVDRLELRLRIPGASLEVGRD